MPLTVTAADPVLVICPPRVAVDDVIFVATGTLVVTVGGTAAIAVINKEVTFRFPEKVNFI